MSRIRLGSALSARLARGVVLGHTFDEFFQASVINISSSPFIHGILLEIARAARRQPRLVRTISSRRHTSKGCPPSCTCHVLSMRSQILPALTDGSSLPRLFRAIRQCALHATYVPSMGATLRMFHNVLALDRHHRSVQPRFLYCEVALVPARTIGPLGTHAAVENRLGVAQGYVSVDPTTYTCVFDQETKKGRGRG